MDDHRPIRQILALKNRLCLSLDISEKERGLSVLKSAGQIAGMIKAGPVPFLSYGKELLHEAEVLGIPVFLDLKWHDIPNTVQETIQRIPSPAIRMVTIHALGGPAMIRAARLACDALGDLRPALIAVTALTHLTEEELSRIGLPGRNKIVSALGSMALESGADGLVLSPHELTLARSLWGANPFLVTPGIRPETTHVAGDDQMNSEPPGRALALGSDLLVVGRPILRASDPVAAIRAILDEIGNSDP